MPEVKLLVIPSHQAQDVLDEWDKEDHYYEIMDISVAGEVNKKARKYPYVPSSDIQAERFFMQTRVPIQSPLRIVYLDPRSDSGLPHTRGLSGIALPIFLKWNPSEKTLDHEIVHLSQKQYSARWWEWYAQNWKIRIARKDEYMRIPERWRQSRRLNPDTLRCHYVVWKDRYIPLTVFSNVYSPKLSQCKRGFWDLWLTQWTWEPPSGWVEFFGSGFNDEHPHEIAAHWLDGSAGVKRQEFFDLNPV